MHFWDKLNLIFHSGAEPLYNLLHLWSRKVVTLSEGGRVIQHMGHLDGIQITFCHDFFTTHADRTCCHWWQFSNLLVIKPAEKFLLKFPHTWLGKGTEKDLGQETSEGSDPLGHIVSQQGPTMALGKSKFFLYSSKIPPPKRGSLDCSQSQDGQKCHRV